MNLPQEIRALMRPAFPLTDHLARSAEVQAFNLVEHMRPRQPINMVRSTCAKLRRAV